MSFGDPFKKMQVPSASMEREARPGDKLEGVRKKIWEKTREVLERVGFEFKSENGTEKEVEIVARLEEIEQLEKGEEYENTDDNLFLEADFENNGILRKLKMVAQKYFGYDPNYKIDYAIETPDYQKEAERRLLREAIIGQELKNFTDGRSVTADVVVEAGTEAGRDMYLVKDEMESTREVEDFGYEEGQKLADTLFNLQYNVDATSLVKKIMKERGYSNQYELENEFSEDIFNDFDGFVDNCRDNFSKKEFKKVAGEIERYRQIIESRQLGEDEYSLSHNETYLDKLKIGSDSEVYLSDWQNIGTTQNRELSMINDLSRAFESASEILDEDRANDFMKGAEDNLKSLYSEREGDNGIAAAEAVIRLTRLRVFKES